MSSPERSINPESAEHAFINIASRITGKLLPVNGEGLRAATLICTAQHESTLPPFARGRMTRMVAQRDPRIRTVSDRAMAAIEREDYARAVENTNHLNAFGQIDHEDDLGGEAFDLSLKAHRLLAAKIFDRFSTSDPFLSRSGKEIFPDIAKAVTSGNFGREHELLRGTIHTVVLNGTLGPESLEYFDPFGVGTIEWI